MTTRGISKLQESGVEFDVLRYRFEHRGQIARVAAEAIGFPPEQVVKSVVFSVEQGEFVFALIGGDATVGGRKLGRAIGRKHAEPASPRDAQRITGYLVGGISPLGSKATLPVVLDASTATQQELVINAGARGTLVKVKTDDLIKVTGAVVADIRA
ncbi:Cys-tRNA(Pro) deacylase [Candidatus Bipolaricaulota bacterium]|nr:Cys-tRNA(Pro) deacylase [Candidatus Bipolaricaulota bacterium]